LGDGETDTRIMLDARAGASFARRVQIEGARRAVVNEQAAVDERLALAYGRQAAYRLALKQGNNPRLVFDCAVCPPHATVILRFHVDCASRAAQLPLLRPAPVEVAGIDGAGPDEAARRLLLVGVGDPAKDAADGKGRR